MKMTGGQAFFECLLEQGVDTIFGYPGGQVIPIYDELYNYTNKINHILPAHEQGGSHAADGYARTSGKVGVCIATSGPGATNLVTGIATAYMDSVPVVFFTGNVPVSLIGTDGFQEVDTTGITMPITKNNWMIKDPNTLPDIIRQAFELAVSGRPGPVLVDIPKDMQTAIIDYVPMKKQPEQSFQKQTEEYERAYEKQIDEAAELIEKSERPYIIIGGGVVRGKAVKQAVEFAEKINAPLSCTLMGVGAIASNHELNTGLLGMHGTCAANTASAQSDLIIAVGTRMSDRVTGKLDTFGKSAEILHIDVDRAEINKNVLTKHHLVGEASVVLELLNKRIKKRKMSEWTKDILSLKEKIEGYKFNGLSPYDVLKEAGNIAGPNAYVVTDVGQHQMWTAQYYPFQKPRLVTSGGLGTMGYGLGAAIGTQIGNPDETVVLVTGDGSFRMNCNELATMQNYNLPIIIILMNNGVLGMVRQWQTLLFDKHYSQTTLDRGPDFVKLAQAYGIEAYKIQNIGEFKEKFENAKQRRKAVILECMIDMDEMVHPMVAPGKPLTDFLME